MDVVLEAFDTFFLDRAWATAFPASLALDRAVDGALARNGSLPFPFGYADNGYEFTPASKFLSFGVSPWANLSRFTRHHWLRQLVSLYFITRCAARPRKRRRAC